MRIHGVPATPIRGAIDAALERARGEWDRAPFDTSAVVLIATLDIVQIRIRAAADIAWSRAKALLEDGWTIEFRDLADELIPWSPADGLVVSRTSRHDAATEPALIAEEDLPPLPSTVIDRLRDTA
jgi:hypothetical protein